MNESKSVVEPDEPEQEALLESPGESDDQIAAAASRETENNESSGIIELPGRKAGEAMQKTAPLTANQESNIIAAYRCMLGAIRERNEDSCLVISSGTGGHFTLLPFGLYIVADGMGGHANGHVASKMATRVVAHHILEQIYLPLLDDKSGLNQTPIQEVLVNAVQAANAAIYEADQESDSGTTLTAALVLGRRLHVAHVGDSRLYVFADGNLETITNDHSLVQRLQDVGQPADDVTYAQIRHVLLRAVGQVEEIEVDTYMRLLPKRGKLLLCTDGLCGLVTDDQIQEILALDTTQQEIVDVLVDTAMEAGGNDNITAVVINFVF